jgi:hypothetical protein
MHMNIIFQTGDFYNESKTWLTVISAISGALISGLIAIGIFRWGIISDKRKEGQRELNRLTELKDYLCILIRNLRPSAHKQAFECIRFGRILKERRANEYLFDSFSSLDLLNIKKIPQQDLYKIIISYSSGSINEKSERLRKIQDNIEFLDSLPNSFIKILDDFNPRFSRFQENWNNSIQRITIFFSTIRSNALIHGIKQGEIDFFADMDNIFFKWQSLKSDKESENVTDWFIVYDMLVKPLFELCKIHQTDPRQIILTNLIYDSKKAFIDLENNLIFTSKYFITQGRKLNKAIIDLDNLINEII